MAKYHPLFHKFKSIVGYSIASVVIIVALGVSGLRLILTTANLYQQEVEQLASSLLEQPVKIGRMDAKLSGLMPTLIFYDVQLLSKKTKRSLFSLAQIDVGLSFDELLWHQKITPEQVTIRGMNLHITRKVDGSYKVKGVDLEGLSKVGESESNSLIENWLLQQGEVGVEDSSFTWIDEQNAGHTWYFDDINFLLKKSQDRHQFLLSSQLPRVLGDKIKLSFDLEGDITTPSTWKLKAFVESKGLNLRPVQTYIKNTNFKLINGVADFKLWLDWENEQLKQLSGDVKLHDFSYHFNKKKIVKLNIVSGVFDSFKDENNTWNVSVDKFNYESDAKALNESKFSLSFNYKGENIETFHVKANYLKLGTLSKIVIDNHLVKQKHENIINNLNLRGEIRDFDIAWKENELHKVNADFSGFGINSWKDIPKVVGLSGSISYEQQEGVISLLTENAVVGFPGLFRKDFKLDQLSADIVFSNTKQGLFFDTKHLLTKNTEVDAVTNVKLWMPTDGSSPHLDLQTYVSKGDISKISHFLPVTIMNKDLVSWLDQALPKGNVDKGTIVFNGKLNDFPFDNKEGVFFVDVEASDLTVNFRKDWPKITKAKLAGNFTGQGLKLHFLTAETENNILYDSDVEIESFLKAELDINIFATGSTYTAMQYLVNSPVLSEEEKIINSMRFSGDVAAEIKLNIPLDDEIQKEKPLTYSGSAKFSNASLFMLNDKIDITGGSGVLFFTERGLSSKNLVANVFDEKAMFTVSSTLKDKNIKIAVNGKMKPGIILKRFDIPGAKNISGKTNFAAEMTFPGNLVKNNHPTLKVNSDLFGVKSNFPEFLYKKEKTRGKFNFTTEFSAPDKVQFSVSLDNNGSAIIELDQSGTNNYLNKGAVSFSSKKAILPNKNILYVDGSINKITPSKWLEALELHKVKGNSPFFVNPVVFNLDELKILTTKNDKNTDNAQVADPGKLPAFEGIVKKLYFDDVFLGRLDFKISQKKQGLHFDEVILSSKNMKLFSHGDWRYSRGSHKTDMDFTLSSEDFGGMLTDLDFAAIIRKGTAQVSGKLKWWGAPTQFSLKKLNGDIQLKLTKGNIKEVDSGAGKLLGFFSLSALPRKLLGDFNASFESGFSFDTAEGEIKIEDGDAYTDDFEINSPIAEVSVSGRTGLADRDYENIVEVVPDVGGGLAGVTALLVNLPAGIGLWLLDKITGEQFNEASTRTYEISGSWETPEIVLIED
ncbi:MAG: hypothetical protein KAJ39_08050 [Gammaproteobacteria bacterium]|nr:hypothetical protein [Gammaproteobacteria bacterium]